MKYRGGSYLLGNMWYVPCVVLRAHLAGPSLQAKPANGPYIAQAPFSILPTINCKPNLRGGKLMWRSQSDALGARCVFCKFFMFSCAHLGSSARNLSKRPKWSTYVESKVIGVKSLCLEGLVDCTIQAEDIII